MITILAVAEVRGNAVAPVTWELALAAREMAALMSGAGALSRAEMLVPAEQPGPAGAAIAARTGLEVHALAWSCPVTPETLVAGLESILDETAPAIVLMAHTTLGREAVPRLAARLGWAAVSGVTAVREEGGAFLFERPVMDNTEIQPVRLSPGTSCLLTLVPGSMGKGGCREPAPEPGRVAEQEVQVPLPAVVRRKMLGPPEKPVSGPDIRTAPIVVSAGQGIGERENLEKIFRFAEHLPGAAVGASRPLVDRGFLPYARQVGITGAVVSPDLYIACGISGSSQHLAGMAGARWVVSINSSADAPICRHADLCIRADACEFIRAFLERRG